jgi:hypothetical protein
VGGRLTKAIGRPRYAILTEDGLVMPCDLVTWARFLEEKQRIIVQEDLAGGYFLSTVFLGLDHNHNLFGPGLWFETMLFRPSDGSVNMITGRVMEQGKEAFMDRYSTLKQALEGHESAKRRFEKGEFEE